MVNPSRYSIYGARVEQDRLEAKHRRAYRKRIARGEEQVMEEGIEPGYCKCGVCLPHSKATECKSCWCCIH